MPMFDAELEKPKFQGPAPSGEHLAELEFSKVYTAWQPKVRCWVASLGAPRSEADDVVQEVFIIVRRKFASFRSGNFAGWLFRITERTARDFRRKAWFRRRTPQDFDVEVWGDPNARDPGALYELVEGWRALDAVVSRMSPKRREAFVLFTLEGYSGEEIAELTQIPLATVWTRLYYARKDLSRLVDWALLSP
jgi:RNA polymerase sigma-70 factor (ECF subfamily)